MLVRRAFVAVDSQALINAATLQIELLADRVLGVQSEKFTGALVHVSDFAAGIGHNDPFLDGVEDGFEESFFLRQSQQIILNIFRPDFAKAAD